MVGQAVFWQPLCHLVILLLVSLLVVTQDVPDYRLRFAVYYNSSGTEDVSHECGTHYAETFLREFYHATSWMESQCMEQGIPSGIEIEIAKRATVKLFNKQVEVSIDISIVGGSRENQIDCGSVLNDTLQHAETASGSNPEIRHLAGMQLDNCTPAMMSPARFYYHEAVWTCGNGNHSYDSEQWACVQNGGTDHGDSNQGEGLVDMTTDMNTLAAGDDVVSGPDSDMTQAYTGSVSRTTSANPITSYTTTHTHPTPTTTQYGTSTSSLIPSSLSSISSPSPSPKPSMATESEYRDVTTAAGLHDYWGIELFDVPPKLYLEEGGKEVILRGRVWANKTALCQGVPQSNCQLSFNYSLSAEGYTSPICRRTGQLVPQVVFGRPSWQDMYNGSYCSMGLTNNVTGMMSDGMAMVSEDIRLALRAVSDNKYDGLQSRPLSLHLVKTVRTGDQREVFIKTAHRIPVEIEDRDRKATCQSINDPHITTFDGLEYNNYYEGEFLLYQHSEFHAKVHAVYQRCSQSINASCNCAVAIQSGDDVLVIDRCYRHKPVVPRLHGSQSPRPFNPMRTRLYLNGELTEGTKVYQEADGKKYYVYLPHGTYIKVLISGLLVNVWIVASPDDWTKTTGLCGVYDVDRYNDMMFRNGTVYQDAGIMAGSREQPVAMMLDWRLDIDSENSLMRGMPALKGLPKPVRYCLCEEADKQGQCSYTMQVDTCDIIQGVDITQLLVKNAIKSPIKGKTRRQPRNVDNDILQMINRDEPIAVDNNFKPSKYKWKSDSEWNEVSAKTFCMQYIRDNYTIGQLCSQIVPSVNFKQDITTCVEDIRITDQTTWAGSARDAMKEQCLEELQKNVSLPSDVAGHLQNSMCINDCSQHGQCLNSTCQCEAGYTSSDCSVSEHSPPYAAEMPHYGLCDIRNMNCSTVIVYGQNFVDCDTLTCYFQECQVDNMTYTPLSTKIASKAIFVDFEAVECIVPEVRPYLISVSNDNQSFSDPLLFLPFDPQCRVCSTFNTTCSKIRNSCIIDNMCYLAGQSSPNDECLVCQPNNNELQWTTQEGMKCQTPWWSNFKLPNWAVAVPAAVGGSIVGILAGILLYKCSCRNQKKRTARPPDIISQHGQQESPFEDAILHRNRGLPVFNSDRFTDINLPQSEPQCEESYFFNDGRGVENGVDSTTYF